VTQDYRRQLVRPTPRQRGRVFPQARSGLVEKARLRAEEEAELQRLAEDRQRLDADILQDLRQLGCAETVRSFASCP
jgi:hypothetical protein